jgi:hypothetical protein
MKLKHITGVAVTLRAFVAGQATAGTADEWVVGSVPFRAKIAAVRFIPAAAITGAATHHFSAQLRNRGDDAAGTTDAATLAFDNGIDATAWVPKTITLSATAADLNVAEGDVLTFEKVVVGNGLAMPEGLIEVDLQAR